jgi:tetratricopeptide (TPR) repeat protein
MTYRILACLCLAASLLGLAACSRDVERSKRQYVERGDKYVAAKDVDAAIIEYRNAIQQDSRFGEAYRKLAKAYLTRGDAADALRAAVTAADLMPQPDVQLEAGELLLLGGRFTDAKIRAQNALNKDAKNVRARVLLGNATAGLNDVDAGIKELQEAIRLDPQQSGIYTGLAVLKATRGDREEAEKTFKEAISLDAKSVGARLALAQFYWSTQRVDEAERTLKEAQAAAPKDVRANVSLAVFYQATRRSAEAETYLKAAAAADPNPRLRILLADYYITRGRPAEARQVLTPLVNERTVASLANLRLAGIAQIEGQPDQAVKIVDATLAADPKNASALAAKSDLLWQQHKLDEAVKVADAAIAANPSSVEAHFIRGRVLTSQGRYAQAEDSFNNALKINPGAVAARVELARLRMRHDPTDAALLATQATQSDPHNLDARLTLARALMQKQDFTASENLLRDIIRVSPDVAVAHAQLGVVLLRRHDSAAARAEFTRALEIDPVQIESIEGLTTLDYAAGHRDEAVARLEALIAREPNNAALLMVGARAYATTNNLDGAERLLLKSIDINPAEVRAYSMLGSVYLAQKRLTAARAQFEKAVGGQERPVGPLTLIGMIDLMENRVPEAQQAFERVIKLDPKAAVAANNLAWIYTEHGGSLDAALELAQVARGQMPNDPSVNDTLGWIYFKKGSLDQAITVLRHSLDLDPKNANAAYHLALAVEKNGDRSQARQLLQRYLALDPTSDRVAEVRRRVAELGS